MVVSGKREADVEGNRGWHERVREKSITAAKILRMGSS